MKIFFILAVINGLLSVALGAFGTHGLEGKISEISLDRWNKAVQYQMFHTVALIFSAMLMDKINSLSILWSGWFFFIGILLFSGSLYFYATTGIKFLAMITPFGGFSFLFGWLFLGYALLKYL